MFLFVSQFFDFMLQKTVFQIQNLDICGMLIAHFAAG
jgi:hypothetical protein